MIAQLGERQTEDLEVLGSIPSPGILGTAATSRVPAEEGGQRSHGALAQLVARRSHNPKVVSSILTGPTCFSRSVGSMGTY